MSNESPIDAKEAAKILGVTARTVIRLADKGEIAGFKVGDVWRFRRLDLENYIEAQINKRKRSPETD